jgi:hypothetical protein
MFMWFGVLLCLAMAGASVPAILLGGPCAVVGMICGAFCVACAGWLAALAWMERR